MATRSARFEVITRGKISGITSAAAVTAAGAASVVESTQPFWIDDASISNQVDSVGYKTGTIAASGSVDIDLTALDGLDGGTVTLGTLVAFYIQVTSTTGGLVIGNASSNAHALDFGAQSHTRTLSCGTAGREGPAHVGGDPSGTGWTVDGTHKIVKLANSSGADSVTYVALFGGMA